MSSDDQFTALGSGDPGEPTFIGFQTSSQTIQRGAEIAGAILGVKGTADKGYGVHGISQGELDGSSGGEESVGTTADPAVKSCGVLGEGKIGVFGRNTLGEGAGIQGESATAGVVGFGGVTGAGLSVVPLPDVLVPGVLGQGTPGVIGKVPAARRLGPNGRGHNGVMGVTEGPSSAGVFGGHRGSPRAAPLGGDPADGIPTDDRKLEDAFGVAVGTGAGIFGQSNDDGRGVVGISRLGTGVVGLSERGRGGSFSSGTAAQLRLEPLRLASPDPNGLVAGAAGDLLALEFSARESPIALWFCKKTGTSATALWAQIV